jgi:tetratricopeptide (TPR) repeat protein
MDLPTLQCIREIGRRLDGIPLAIELAAARARTLAPAQILDRLADRFRLLTGGRRTLARHQTLEALIAWSHGLLTAKERLLFRRLSVFLGGWSLEAAEEVCAGRELVKSEILDLLARLVDKSLVVCEAPSEQARFRMLETIRAYASQRQAEEGSPARSGASPTDSWELHLRHRAYFADLAHRAVRSLRTSEEKAWTQRVRADAENLRAAVVRTFEADIPPEDGLQITGDIARLWFAIGHWSEARAYGRRILARVGADTPTRARYDALSSLGYLAVQQGDKEEGRALLERALEVAKALADPVRLASAYGYLGNLCYVQGRLSEAMAHQQEALGINRANGYELGMSINLSNLGNILEVQGDYAGACVRHRESMALARKLGDLRSVGYSLCRIGDANLLLRDFEESRRVYRESLGIRRELEDRWGIAVSLVGLGEVERNTGRPEAALPLIEEGAQILREIGDRYSLGKVVAKLAETVQALGDPERARREALEALRISLEIDDRRDMVVHLLLLATVALEQADDPAPGILLGAAERIAGATELTPAEWNAPADDLRAVLERRFGAGPTTAAITRGTTLDVPQAVEAALGAHLG